MACEKPGRRSPKMLPILVTTFGVVRITTMVSSPICNTEQGDDVVTIKHETERRYGGSGETSWIQPTCACGWEGDKHYAFHDFQRTNVREEENSHLRDVYNKEANTEIR